MKGRKESKRKEGGRKRKEEACEDVMGDRRNRKGKERRGRKEKERRKQKRRKRKGEEG